MKRPRTRIWYAAVATAVFIGADHLNDLMRPLGLRRWLPPLVVLGLRNLLEILSCFGGISLAHPFGFGRVARELGLRAPVRRALAFSFVAALPMLLFFALTSRVSPSMTWLSVGVGCFVAPFAEEALFRAYLFRQLYRHARLGFWLSAAIPSVLFALGHLYQSTDLPELAGILAVTGSGSLLGCWIFMRWDDNFWAVFGLHSLMNLWWEVFGVDDTALGGWLANGARLLTISLAVLITIYRDRLWKPLAVRPGNGSDPQERGPGRGGAALRVSGPAPA